ncbi:MAG: ribosome maturation factor RimP [Gammaproteobacteria bacterium]|nr:ribosome maturation factor RimP [Gammaproteobacteria bacterium]
MVESVIGGVSKQQTAINVLVAPVVRSLGYDYVGCEYMPHGPRALIRIYIDSQSEADNGSGITVDDCSRVSRQLTGLLNVESPVSSDYALEVSSPGVERKLFFLADFERFAGRQVALRLTVPIKQKRRLTGELMGTEGESVVLQIDGERSTVPLTAIARAQLVVEY